MRYGAKPNPLQVAPGISVTYSDAENQAHLVEWGSSISWSPTTHKVAHFSEFLLTTGGISTRIQTNCTTHSSLP